jgi:hypothetical protein
VGSGGNAKRSWPPVAFKCGMPSMYANLATPRLTDAGRITKLAPTVAVTVRELLDYLSTCGIAARYADESFNGYLCNGKRVNLRALLHFANLYRSSDELPPLTIRHLL